MAEIILKNIWLFLIVGTFVNGFIFKIKSQKYIKENPELKTGYDKIFKGWIIFGNIPWLIIGIGNMTNYTKSFLDYFNPDFSNPFVLMFYLSIIILWILSIIWIYFKDGAEFLEKHPWIMVKNGFNGVTDKITAKQIKIFFGLALLGGIIGLSMMLMIDIPAPTF